MPKRTDIQKIMVIGSGPIIIGQAAEFDYAGTQACLALKEEGYSVVLVNSNPATIMTDKELIKQQQEKIERIEQLQEKLHKLSTLTLLTIDLLNLPNDLKTPAKVIHDVSHVIKDVLDGMSSQEAIEKNMIEDDEE